MPGCRALRELPGHAQRGPGDRVILRHLEILQRRVAVVRGNIRRALDLLGALRLPATAIRSGGQSSAFDDLETGSVTDGAVGIGHAYVLLDHK